MAMRAHCDFCTNSSPLADGSGTPNGVGLPGGWYRVSPRLEGADVICCSHPPCIDKMFAHANEHLRHAAGRSAIEIIRY